VGQGRGLPIWVIVSGLVFFALKGNVARATDRDSNRSLKKSDRDRATESTVSTTDQANLGF
jgi:hypothetical protein